MNFSWAGTRAADRSAPRDDITILLRQHAGLEQLVDHLGGDVGRLAVEEAPRDVAEDSDLPK